MNMTGWPARASATLHLPYYVDLIGAFRAIAARLARMIADTYSWAAIAKPKLPTDELVTVN